MEATTALEHPRIARIMLLVGLVALVALVAMDPVAAWPTTNMPSAGGSSAYWYETSSSDPLTIVLG